MKFQDVEVRLNFEEYNNGGAAIMVEGNWDGYFETGWVATVWVPGIPEGCVGIKDYSENSGMVKFLLDEGIIELTGQYIPSGFVAIPVARLTEKAEKIKESGQYYG